MTRPLALVTGGARRLGAAIATELADRGASVAVHYHRSREDAETLVERLRKSGADAWAIRGDLREESVCRALVDDAARAAGRPVSVLVNNASEFPRRRPLDVEWRDVEDSLRVHYFAPLLLLRALASAGRPASVVNVLDATRPEHDRAHAAYQVGKRALADLTRVAARELAPLVRVNAVAPGAILPPEGADPALLDRLARALPLGRHGSPEDVARAVAYLAFAPFVTGVTIPVDGGARLLGGVRA